MEPIHGDELSGLFWSLPIFGHMSDGFDIVRDRNCVPSSGPKCFGSQSVKVGAASFQKLGADMTNYAGRRKKHKPWWLIMASRSAMALSLLEGCAQRHCAFDIAFEDRRSDWLDYKQGGVVKFPSIRRIDLPVPRL
jgi:hypothetical protein